MSYLKGLPNLGRNFVNSQLTKIKSVAYVFGFFTETFHLAMKIFVSNMRNCAACLLD